MAFTLFIEKLIDKWIQYKKLQYQYYVNQQLIKAGQIPEEIKKQIASICANASNSKSQSKNTDISIEQTLGWDVFISYSYNDDRNTMKCLKKVFDSEGITCFPDNLDPNRTCGWDVVKNAIKLSVHFVIVISKESLSHIENSSTYSREIKQISEFVDNPRDPRKCYVAICDGIQVNHAIITLLNDERLCADEDLQLALEKIKNSKVDVYGLTLFRDLANDIKESKRTLWK